MWFTKNSLVVTNVLIFIAGVIVMAIASVTIYKRNKYGDLLMEVEYIDSVTIYILTFAIFICILGFLEFAGALRESKYVLYTYAVIMLVFFLVELVLALCLLFRQGVTRNALESFLNKQLQKYNESDEPLTEDIDGMQKYQQCCGVNGTEYWTQIGKQIPDSCLCKMETDYNCQKSSGVEYFHYQQGCVKAILENHLRKDIYLGAATLVLTFLMFISMATAFGLAKKSNYKYINESFIKYKDNRAKKPMS